MYEPLAWTTLVVLFCMYSTTFTHAQDVLAVSSLQTCTSVSYGDVQLSCEDTQSTATVLVVRTNGAQSTSKGGNPAEFEFQMASLPPFGGTSASSDSNVRCTTPDPTTNQCGATQRVRVRITSEPPVRRFQLSEIPMFEVPFTYFFSLVDGSCSTRECMTARGLKYPCPSENDLSKCCTYQGTSVSQSQTSSIKTAPTADLIAQWFETTKHGARGKEPGEPINCPTRYEDVTGYTAPNGQVVEPGSTALMYNFDCGGKLVQFYASFYQLAPMCRAYRLEQNEVVGRIEVQVEDVDSGVVRTVKVDTAQYETAGVTVEGDLLVRVLNVQSASDTLVQSLPGILLVCGDAVPVDVNNPDLVQVPPLDMFPAPAIPGEPVDVLKNPWLDLDPDEVRYTYPTPQMINKVRQRDTPAPNQFYFFLDFDQTLSVGRQCGQLGVPPDYYRFANNQNQFDLYAAQLNKPPITSYTQIKNLEFLHTCVPEFGLGYRNRLNIPTPCAAVAFFHNGNQGDVDARKLRYNSGDPLTKTAFLPAGSSVEFPNVAIHNDFLYMYSQLDAQWEVSIALRATLLGVISRPFSGTIDRTTFTSCGLENNNPKRVGVISGYVCSGVPRDSVQLATYVLYAECDAASGLFVASPTERFTKALASGKCELLSFDLKSNNVFVPAGAARRCLLYLGSTDAQLGVAFIPNGSLTLDSVQLFCGESNIPSTFTSKNLLINVSDGVTLSNGSVMSRKTYVPPDAPDVNTSWYIWGFLALVVGIGGVGIVAVILFCVARFKIGNSTKINVVD